MHYPVYMATYEYDVRFVVEGKLTSAQYRLVSNLLETLVNELDLELLEDEIV